MESQKNKNDKQVLEKLLRYCSYQDRCVLEAKKKLADLKIWGAKADGFIKQLTEHGVIDEQRYAISYARGKFRNNHWGRIRISQELRMRNISDKHISQALEAIDEEEYHTLIHSLAQNKAYHVKAKDDFERNGKVARYLINKGFEPDLVWKAVKELD